MLTVTVKAITAASISIAYQVTNTENTDLYVADLLYRPAANGSLSVDPQFAYTMPAENGLLYTGKLMLQIPDGMRVETTDAPYYRRVVPGETISGEIVLTNPAMPYHPYDSYILGENPFAISRIIVQIGVISAAKIKPDEGVMIPAPAIGLAHFKADYGYGLDYQEVLQAELDVANTGATFLPITAVDR
ncbi:hypothetical protein [uncultured Roseibium sp.]|uniref:hypothetical protein n=1 Tax=uncultured Roseibium sp. TaxID=1936171 RepID=UPI002614BD43|nr:hypothetical protein [uncultured Roseibium sp.]